MTESNSRTSAAISAGAFLLAVAFGLVVGYTTGDYISAIWVVLIAFGLYMVVASRFRNRDQDSFGPSEADAMVAGGLVMAGIGAAGLVYTYTGEVVYTAVVILVVLALTGIMMAVKNRSVREWE
jgi:hypothetical protein